MVFAGRVDNTRRIQIYAYGIDLNNEPSHLLDRSPKLMPLLGSVSSTNTFPSMRISANSQYAGSIFQLDWNGKNFINNADHGRLLQSASSFYPYPNAWTAECYNPREAGTDENGNTTCTDSELLEFVASGNSSKTKTQMAFWSHPNTGSDTCSTPKNSTKLSSHIFEKLVELDVPNIPNAIKYFVKFTVPSNEIYLGLGQFEILTGYLNPEFNTFYRFNQGSQILQYSNTDPKGEAARPVILSTSDGNYAMGVYTPGIPQNPPPGQGYGQFKLPAFYTNKWNVVRRIENLQPGATYEFTIFVAVGSLETVRQTLGNLTIAYPN